MPKTILALPDGTYLSSGGPGAAIVSAKLTSRVNTEENLMPGACQPDRLEISLIEAAGVQAAPGEQVELYYRETDGEPEFYGTFLVEKAQRRGLGILELTARDMLSLLDKDLTRWLMELEGWPYTLQDFAAMVCNACGLELVAGEIPNGQLSVQRFSAKGVTGKDLMQWAAQACGRFCRVTPTGQVELMWYRQTPVTLTPTASAAAELFREGISLRLPQLTQSYEEGALEVTCPRLAAADDGAGNVTVTLTAGDFYIQRGSLRRADFLTAPVDKVCIRADEEDLGTVYPPEEAGENACVLMGNPLLTACAGKDLQPVAQSLYTLLRPMVYTPCVLTTRATTAIRPGDLVTVEDLQGHTFPVYVMATELSAKGLTLTCTGSATYTKSDDRHSYRALSGRILRLQADVEGLRVENEDAAGTVASLALSAENLRTQVEKQTQTEESLRQQISLLEQTAQGVSLKVRTLEEDGTSAVRTQSGYTFDDSGLRISRTGQEMVNLLDNTGMYVMRREDTILQANGDGVIATDVSVRNYLNIGTHARLEDFAGGRTACYWREE